jgi:hypothetical protein
MGGRTSPAHRTCARLRRALGSALALASAAALLLGSLGPLQVALAAEESGPACCRGRCCCNRLVPSDDACVRAVCHCGGDRHALVPVAALPDVVLTPASAFVPPPPALAEPCPAAARAPSRAWPVPHPPPRLHPEIPSAV